MKLKLGRTGRLVLVTTTLCITLTALVLMEAFVIPKTYVSVEPKPLADTREVSASITEYSYNDEKISISISTIREEDVIYHLVDIRLADIRYFQSAFAKDIYGKNVVETTSAMALKNQAILAFNGDLYGSRDSGLIIRNGILYRDIARKTPDNRTLLMDDQGGFSFITEGIFRSDSYHEKGIVHSFSYGPVLVEDGVARSLNDHDANPVAARTAIGLIEPLHYILIVVEGNASESKGMTLDSLARLFVRLKAVSAYNLSGGGSSTLWFNGRRINQTSGFSLLSDERAISDIFYIGY